MNGEDYDYPSGPNRRTTLEQAADIATILLAVIGLYQLLSGRKNWLSYGVVVLFVLLVVARWPRISHVVRRLRAIIREKRAVRKYRGELMSFVERGQAFVLSQTDDAIPPFIRNSLSRDGIWLFALNQSIDTLFYWCFCSLSSRMVKQTKSFKGFVTIMREFYEIMDAFVPTYVDDVIRELKKPENAAKLTSPNRISLKHRYDSLNQLIVEWDSFVSRFTNEVKRHDVWYKLQKPSESLD